jgi:hypothetical protein
MIPPPRHAEIDIEDQMDCVRREINKRKEVYPRLVAAGKLSQQKADQEIDLMRAVLVTLLWAHDRDSHAWIYGDEPENEVTAVLGEAAE